MKKEARNETLDWLCERLAQLGGIRPKRMFGGYGLYCDGLFFAIVVDEVLYLKTDSVSRPEFESAGCSAFAYLTKGEKRSLGYFTLPDDAIDDEQALLVWARKGLAAALRARAAEARGRDERKRPAAAAD